MAITQIKNLKTLNALQNHDENEIVFCEENEKYYTWQENNGWQEVKINDDGVSINLYELNKSIINQFMPLTISEVLDKAQIIENMHNTVRNIHYMLLCKEYNYYTIFEADDNPIVTLKVAVCDILEELGDIYSIEAKEDEAIEFWIKPFGEEEPFIFYFFPYDKGVVYYG